jgi:uncharacterized protein (TIGR03435 family)
MKKTGKILLIIAASVFAVIPLPSQTTAAPQKPKPSFEVISIKPSAPGPGIRGGGTRGDRFNMAHATLKMLLQQAYQKTSAGTPSSQLQIIGGPNWMDSDQYDITATADCSGGVLSRDQVQLMVRSLLEDRFQLKAHMETRELPLYNLVAGKDGPKIKASADQTPPNAGRGGPPQPCSPASPDAQPSGPPVPPPPPPGAPGQRGGGLGPIMDPNFQMPRGSMAMMFNGTAFTMRATAVPITSLIGMFQQQIGRQVIDKTGLTGLFDFILQFSSEGLSVPGLPPGAIPPPDPGPAGAAPGAAPAAADPVPSLFTAIQELGLRLESSKGPVDVLVVDSAQKPTEN